MNNKVLTVVAVLALALTGIMVSQSDASQHLKDFEDYKLKFGKMYMTEQEEAMRFAIFVHNQEIAKNSNSQGKTYTLGVTEFSDMSNQEFKQKMCTLKPGMKRKSNKIHDVTKTVTAESIDWRDHGAVNAVKNQGQCGSCWAFSTVAACESVAFNAGGTLYSLSEQQQVDCNTNCSGCSGGLMDYGFLYFQQNKICTEASYPYTAQDGSCKASSCGSKISWQPSGYTDVTHNSQAALQNAVSGRVVSIAIEADQEHFQMYTGGILSAAGCGTQLDHGVAVVGYSGSSYWIVRNSWGPTWGLSGYVKMQADGQNTCGLLSDPSYPDQ